VSDRDGVTVEEQVAMFLHVVGHNQRFTVVHQSFRRSIETVHRHFHQVLYAVGELRNEMIKPPSTAIHPKVLGSHKWNPFLKVIVKHMFLHLVDVHIHMYCYLISMVFRTVLVPLMAPMCWQGCLDTCRLLSGVGNTTPHKMS